MPLTLSLTNFVYTELFPALLLLPPFCSLLAQPAKEATNASVRIADIRTVIDFFIKHLLIKKMIILSKVAYAIYLYLMSVQLSRKNCAKNILQLRIELPYCVANSKITIDESVSERRIPF